MSEQLDKNSLYYMPTPNEYLKEALDTLERATDDNWRECIDTAKKNLLTVDDWMGRTLLFNEEEEPYNIKGEG